MAIQMAKYYGLQSWHAIFIRRYIYTFQFQFLFSWIRRLFVYRREDFPEEEDAKAVQYFSEAILLNPQYAKAYNNRGFAYEELLRLRSNSAHGRSGRVCQLGLKVVALADVNGVGRKPGREDVRCHSG